ncbi:hypothetical protein KSP39_PZI001531 [Platanthera zijinensis]|uniref:Uncharacterized protein n=1 Tax=Platanthera zijinensis TaxID=2320716 RepID=A0AAP0GFY0_9ASPA
MCSAAAGVDPAAFERLFPSRFLSFSFPNPLPFPGNPYDATLRIAVADSLIPHRSIHRRRSPRPRPSLPRRRLDIFHPRRALPASSLTVLLLLPPHFPPYHHRRSPRLVPLPRSYSRPQPRTIVLH